jgi:hypothetical protein
MAAGWRGLSYGGQAAVARWRWPGAERLAEEEAAVGWGGGADSRASAKEAAVVCATRRRQLWEKMDLVGTIEKLKKGLGGFQTHLYSSVLPCHRRIYVDYICQWHDSTDEYMGPVKVTPDDPYIHRCPTQIDEYNLIFIGFRTNGYNLNIFVSTD